MIFNISAMSQKTTNEKVIKFVIHITVSSPDFEADYSDFEGYLYNETPLHRDNFVKLVKEGYYDGLLFHRVISGFMIQGGDPNSRDAKPGIALGSGGPGYTIPAEFNKNLIHKKGALAAARQPDQVNPEKASSGSQFYIVQGKTYSEAFLNEIASQKGYSYTDDQRKIYETLGGTPFLDMNYTVFGEITNPIFIEQIAAYPTVQGDRPIPDIKMTIKLID